MQLGTKIGQGLTAEIFEWEEGKIVKLFYPEVPAFFVEHEWRISKEIQFLNLPVPKVFETVQLHERVGIVYERIVGETMLGYLSKHPEQVKEMAQQMAELHAMVHAQQIADEQIIPSVKKQLLRDIGGSGSLTTDTRQAIEAKLESLDNGTSLCHRDFHPDNILIAEKGPIIIDWSTSAVGDPAADVARTVLILTYASLPDGLPEQVANAIQTVREQLSKHYLDTYCALTNMDSDQIKDWMLPIAAGRLVENVPADEKEKLLALIVKSL